MPARLSAALALAGVAAVTAVTVLGTVAPAFAKSDTQLSGPRVAHARHAFRLTVSIGDDAGVRPAMARLQMKEAHGRYQWLGPWHRLHRTDQFDASYAFTLTENHRGTVTFRAVVSSGYATTGPVTVTVR